MKKHYLYALFLFSTGGGLGTVLQADGAAPPPYYITLDAAYGKPFSSPGYSGRVANGFGGGLSFDYRGWDAYSVGLGYNHIAISQDPISAGMGTLDAFVRLMPFGRGTVEPYALLAAGALIYSNATGVSVSSNAGYHANLQLGALFSLNPNWAVNTSLGYHRMGSDPSMNYGDFRVGLQMRYGQPSAAKVEADKVQVKEMDAQKLKDASSKMEWKVAPGADALSVTAKAWVLEIKSKDGKIVKTLQGKGPAPKEIHVQGLLVDQNYNYQLTLVPASGKLIVKTGTLPEPSLLPVKLKKTPKSPAAKPVQKGEYKVQKGDTLWAIATRPDVLGEGLLWPLLYDINKERLKEAGQIYVGMILAVPSQPEKSELDEIRMRAWRTHEFKPKMVASATKH